MNRCENISLSYTLKENLGITVACLMPAIQMCAVIGPPGYLVCMNTTSGYLENGCASKHFGFYLRTWLHITPRQGISLKTEQKRSEMENKAKVLHKKHIVLNYYQWKNKFPFQTIITFPRGSAALM